MATYTLTTNDLDEHIIDAQAIVSRIYTDVPISYRVKEIIVTDTTTPTYSSAPAVTISAPNLVGGIQATASASIVVVNDGTETSRVIRIIVTNPGSGYTSIPTVTIGGGTEAVAALEIDPIILIKRQQLIDTVNSQIIEEATHINTAAIDLNTSTINDAIDRNTAVLAEIRDEFDVTLTNNLASVVENLDNSTNDLIRKSLYDIDNISGTFVVGEKVTSSTGSGYVMHFDSIQGDIAIGYISGDFEDNQTLTGQTSEATATIQIDGTAPTGASNDRIARAMMVLNLKATNNLDNLRNEINDPTVI